jgi:hypothetical protein
MFEERRRQKRVDVNIPIRVKGADVWGNRFEEVTKSINVSSDGACFLLKHEIKSGSTLELSLPLPRQLQKSVRPKTVYETIGFVTRMEVTETPETFRVAVKFRASNIKHYRSES